MPVWLQAGQEAEQGKWDALNEEEKAKYSKKAEGGWAVSGWG